RSAVLGQPQRYAFLAQQTADRCSGVVIAYDTGQGYVCAQSSSITSNVSGATQAVFAARDMHDRHRRLGRNSMDVAKPIAIEHDIANDQDARAGNCSRGK